MGSEDDGDHRFDFPRKGNHDINGQIMFTAVICLSFVVAIVVTLHIYARCVLRRQARRRAAIRHLSMGIMASQVQANEPPRTGLDPSVIATLPTFMFKEVDRVDKNASVECSVCLSVLEEEEMARILPNCKHMFHAECIDMWLGAHSTCPICRTEAEPPAQPEPVQVSVAVHATAPPLDTVNPTVQCSECSSDIVAQNAKVNGSSSRLSSFRRMLSRERSERRVQIQAVEQRDLERQ